jgi:dephospho-CoA kinase
MQKLVVGVIGSIGSGKSRVAELLARRGGRVISGDQAGHEALAQPELRDRIVQRFGSHVLTPGGDIDRRRLGAIVFADARQRKALEEIVFPWIRENLAGRIADALVDPAVSLIVLDAAVLIEAGWDDRCDRLVYVDAPRQIRLERVARQRGWSAAELAAREQAQLPLDLKAARADFLLTNDGTEDDLLQRVDRVLDQLCAGAPSVSSTS